MADVRSHVDGTLNDKSHIPGLRPFTCTCVGIPPDVVICTALATAQTVGVDVVTVMS